MQLTTFRDIVYDTSIASRTQIPLKLDVVVPQKPGSEAEQGYVVASVEYRTVTTGATYTDSVADIKVGDPRSA